MLSLHSGLAGLIRADPRIQQPQGPSRRSLHRTSKPEIGTTGVPEDNAQTNIDPTRRYYDTWIQPTRIPVPALPHIERHTRSPSPLYIYIWEDDLPSPRRLLILRHAFLRNRNTVRWHHRNTAQKQQIWEVNVFFLFLALVSVISPPFS